jgi:hypothetical protein
MSRDAMRSCQLVLTFATLVAAGACSEEMMASLNLRPLVPSQEVATDEDTAIDIRVLDTARDPDGDPLTVVSADAGEHTIEIVDHVILRFTPKPNFNGTATVSYAVSDAHNEPVTGT